MSEIVYHLRDGSAVTKDNSFTGNHSNTPKKTKNGWELLIECKNETKTWVGIKYVKEEIPIDMTEYAVENHISDKPVFAWWVPYTLKKRNIIISKVNRNYWKTTHMYRVRLPNNVTEAMQIDQINGNTYWKDAIEKYTKEARITYKPIEYCTPEEVWKREGR